MGKSAFRFASAGVAFASLAGCATYQGKIEESRELLRNGRADEAAQKLAPLAARENDDQLVYMLDWATALQLAGHYRESASAFNRAEKIADVQDYHSLSNIASSLVLSEEMVQYKGDDYEKVLINAVNAINYLMMGLLDDALVEVRKVNQKLRLYRTEAKRDYEQNPFAYYLSAMIWEAGQRWDDAYIDYKRAYDLIPNYAPLREDLLRSSMRAQRADEFASWKAKFPEIKTKSEWRDRTMGELIVIHQQGWGPRKSPRPESFRFPHLTPTSSTTHAAEITLNDVVVAHTQEIYSVTRVAIKTIDDAFAGLAAKRVAGIATKAVLADQLRQQNQLLGAVAWIALNATDRADLRQWSTLPDTFQIARIPLKAGAYKLEVKGLGWGGSLDGENMPGRTINVTPGKKTFVAWRSLR